MNKQKQKKKMLQALSSIFAGWAKKDSHGKKEP